MKNLTNSFMITICMFVWAVYGASDFIVQLAPGVEIDHFLGVYPSLRYRTQGNVTIGSFRAVYGNFDPRFSSYLKFSSLVSEITKDVTTTILDVQNNSPRHLARLSQVEKLSLDGPHDYVYDPSGGEGIDVYIFDSGIYRQHPDFEHHVVLGVDYTGEGLGDKNGHGTHVAGLVSSKTYGVAKRANVIDMKVIAEDGHGKLSWVLSAMEYVTRVQQTSNRPSVINMSFGMPKNQLLNKAIQSIYEMDIAVVAAAGNSDTSSCRFSPSSAPAALVIGSFDDRTDTVASFSNWGQCVDAFAPGVNVKSLSHLGEDGIRDILHC